MSVWTHEYAFGVLGHNLILCCCSTCFSFGNWEFFQLACVSLWHIPLIVGFFQHFLTFCHYKMQAHLIHFPSSVLDSAIAPRSPVSLHGRIILKTKMWALGMFIAIGCHCFWACLGGRARKHMCVYLPVNICISTNMSICYYLYIWLDR